jgi:DNA-binding NarL/FixJ family response regulator
MFSSSRPITIGIAEDHPAMRKGIRDILDTDDEFEIIFEVSNGSELLAVLRHQQPAILILDISMPYLNGIEALPLIRKINSEIKIVLFSTYVEDSYVEEAILNGANAYLQKNVELDEFIHALKFTQEKGFFFNSIVTKSLVNKYRNGNNVRIAEKDLLTKREIEILNYICKGLTNIEIATKLFRSIRTVENHRKNIFYKIKARNLPELIVFAIKNGYYTINSD